MNVFLLIILIIVLLKFFTFKEGLCPVSCSKCATINNQSLIIGTGDCGKECISCDLNTPTYIIDLYERLYGAITIPVINSVNSVFKSLYKCSFKDNIWGQDISGDSLCLADGSNNWHKYSEPVIPTPIKCIADYGTEIGEKANSTSKTIVTSTKYVCPSIMPTCDNFKCGATFGVCK
jgi:hypothetical protein